MISIISGTELTAICKIISYLTQWWSIKTEANLKAISERGVISSSTVLMFNDSTTVDHPLSVPKKHLVYELYSICTPFLDTHFLYKRFKKISSFEVWCSAYCVIDLSLLIISTLFRVRCSHVTANLRVLRCLCYDATLITAPVRTGSGLSDVLPHLGMCASTYDNVKKIKERLFCM